MASSFYSLLNHPKKYPFHAAAPLHGCVLELLAHLLNGSLHLALCALCLLGLGLGRGCVLGELLAKGDEFGGTREVLAQNLGNVETLLVINKLIWGQCNLGADLPLLSGSSREYSTELARWRTGWS